LREFGLLAVLVAVGLLCLSGRAILTALKPRKEGCAMTFFRHYRQRGPVHALQMRLQG